MILSTPRTGLRTMVEQDARALSIDDLEATTYLGYMGVTGNADQRVARWQATHNDPAARFFAIIACDSDEKLIGHVLLKGINYERGLAEFGISIPFREFWNRGYGTEATGLALEYCFTHLSLYNVYLWTQSYNHRAIRAYQKAGFKEAGRLRGAMLIDGVRFDHVLMDIVRDDPRPRYRAAWVDEILERAG